MAILLHPPSAAVESLRAQPVPGAATRESEEPVSPAPTTFSPTFTALLIAFAGAGLLLLAVAAALPLFRTASSFPLLDHRGELALSGLTVLLALGIGVMAAVVLG